mmetsp:Transcript_33863/g.58148  ORF Transcript_33863/g.58148 Transcript_33863/m.58148 type:complete len:207 (-) Transcript_33863:131-751(-)
MSGEARIGTGGDGHVHITEHAFVLWPHMKQIEGSVQSQHIVDVDALDGLILHREHKVHDRQHVVAHLNVIRILLLLWQLVAKVFEVRFCFAFLDGCPFDLIASVGQLSSNTHIESKYFLSTRHLHQTFEDSFLGFHDRNDLSVRQIQIFDYQADVTSTFKKFARKIKCLQQTSVNEESFELSLVNTLGKEAHLDVLYKRLPLASDY